MDGDGAGGKLSTPLRNRGGGGGASPAATRGGVHASPGAAAAARAISEEIAATGHKITVTPSRPTPTRQRAKGASTGGDWSRGGGNKENKGMLSFVCFSMGGEGVDGVCVPFSGERRRNMVSFVHGMYVRCTRVYRGFGE